MKIAEYATNAGVSETKLPSVIAAVAGAGGMPVSVEGVTNTQMAAAQLGRLVGYSKCYSYIYYEMLPWAALAAIGKLRFHPRLIQAYKCRTSLVFPERCHGFDGLVNHYRCREL